MCRAVRCKTCGKTTWAGCGQHVNQVYRLNDVSWCVFSMKVLTRTTEFRKATL